MLSVEADTLSINIFIMTHRYSAQHANILGEDAFATSIYTDHSARTIPFSFPVWGLWGGAVWPFDHQSERDKGSTSRRSFAVVHLG